MSVTIKCPFGCQLIQNELLQFKQISINYFDQIMFKFNNQDKIINDLVSKLDQCLNINGEDCAEYDVVDGTDTIDEIEETHEPTTNVECFSAETQGDYKYSTDMQQVFDEQGEVADVIVKVENASGQDNESGCFSRQPETDTDERLSDIRAVCEQLNNIMNDGESAVELMGGTMIEREVHSPTKEPIDPVESAEIDAAYSNQPDHGLVAATSFYPDTIGRPSFRASGNRKREKVIAMNVSQIRLRYYTTLKYFNGVHAIKCNLCEKEFYWNRSNTSSRISNFATHVKMVHFGMQYQCKVCKWSGQKKSRVQRHVEQFHSKPISEVNQHIEVIFSDFVS